MNYRFAYAAGFHPWEDAAQTRPCCCWHGPAGAGR